jgi:hypothetical protein
MTPLSPVSLSQRDRETLGLASPQHRYFNGSPYHLRVEQPN